MRTLEEVELSDPQDTFCRGREIGLEQGRRKGIVAVISALRGNETMGHYFCNMAANWLLSDEGMAAVDVELKKNGVGE